MDPLGVASIILLALVASAFSSGMEIAFITANKLKVELDRKQGLLSAGIIAWFQQRPKLYIASMLVGNNIALVVYGYYMGEAVMTGLDMIWGNAELVLGKWGELLTQTAISTIVVLFFGEYIPKAIFSVNPNRWLNLFAPLLVIWFGVLFVFAWSVTKIADLFLRIFLGKAPEAETVEFGRVDLNHYLEEVTGNIHPGKNLDHEIQIFQNALDFSKIKARDCLIPRNEIVAVDLEDSIENLTEKFIQTRLSKILVYCENIDHCIGYVHSYELFRHPSSIKSVVRPVLIIPEPMPANEILEMFIKQKRNVAVVVDEFGGTAGVITMEDIVEEIFGDIEDEHDREDLVEQKLSDQAYIFSARLEINYLNDTYGLGLPADEDQYDTLGGLILYLVEDIPEKGSVIENEGFNFEIMEVSDTRVETVKIKIRE
ncbi:MAG: HlyC/CorC family transporter [Flavobacteriales bacterium]|nr:HlyC/CorC family transporter [Flavobacteriales bacterium]